MALKFWVTAPFFWADMSRPWSELQKDMLRLAEAAEELGYEGVTVNENLFQNYTCNPSSLAFAAIVAARTERLRIMPGVVVLPIYNPLQIASEMSALDNFAPGRIDIGVARGGARYPLDRLGVDMSEARDIYEESLEIIRRVWTEDDVSFDGRYFSFPPTTVLPKPVTQPHPQIWVASQSIQGVKKVAEEGLNLVTAPNFGTFEPHGDLQALLEAYESAVAESGMPRGEVMVYRHALVGRTEAEALKHFEYVVDEWNHYMAVVKGSGSAESRESRLTARTAGVRIDDFIVKGRVRPETETASAENLFESYDDPILTTPDRMIERFKSYEAMGVDHVACLIAMGQPIEDLISNMKMMAAEVFPAFQGS